MPPTKFRGKTVEKTSFQHVARWTFYGFSSKMFQSAEERIFKNSRVTPNTVEQNWMTNFSFAMVRWAWKIWEIPKSARSLAKRVLGSTTSTTRIDSYFPYFVLSKNSVLKFTFIKRQYCHVWKCSHKQNQLTLLNKIMLLIPGNLSLAQAINPCNHAFIKNLNFSWISISCYDGL